MSFDSPRFQEISSLQLISAAIVIMCILFAILGWFVLASVVMAAYLFILYILVKSQSFSPLRE